MNIHFTASIVPTWTRLKRRVFLAACAAFVAVAVIGILGPAQGAIRKSDAASVGLPTTPYATSLRSTGFDGLRDYRIYVVGSQEQADSLGSVLSELEEHARYSTGQLGWVYEVVVLESPADELGFARTIADLNDDRLIRGLPEVWVVDYRDL